MQSLNYIDSFTLQNQDMLQELYRSRELANAKDVEVSRLKSAAAQVTSVPLVSRKYSTMTVQAHSTVVDHQNQLARAKQEVLMAQREMHQGAERERRKDQLLELQKSKEERLDAELASIRQVGVLKLN